MKKRPKRGWTIHSESPLWDKTLKELGPEFVAQFFYLDSQDKPMPSSFWNPHRGQVLAYPAHE